MNREAVALGTPVFTVFEGRLGAVDEQLIAEGRLARLERPEQVALVKRDPAPMPRARWPSASGAIRRSSSTCSHAPSIWPERGANSACRSRAATGSEAGTVRWTSCLTPR